MTALILITYLPTLKFQPGRQNAIASHPHLKCDELLVCCIMILIDMSLKQNFDQKRYFRLGVLLGMLLTIIVVWDLAGWLMKAAIVANFAIIVVV